MIIEPIQKSKHQRSSFRCANESLDRFLHESACQAVEKGLSRTYVAVDESDETSILGYYAVTTTHIEAGALPSRTMRKLELPKHELPAALVARLAVSERRQKHGIGSLLLIDALARCARAADEIGGVAIAVDALNESVVAWYELLGFMRFEPGSLKMFIVMATVREMLGLT